MDRTNLRASKGRYYARYMAHYTKHNMVLIVLGLLFVFGVCLGTMLVRTAQPDLLDTFSRMLNGHISRRYLESFGHNLTSALTTSLLLLFAVMLAGFWALAKPVIWAVPVLKGMGMGFMLASIYAWHGVKAVSFISIFILPNMVLSTIALLLSCKEALKMSGIFFAVLRPDSSDPERYSIRLYLFKFILLALLCLLAALAEALAYLLLSNQVSL